MAKIKKCCVCGSEYEFCNNCPQTASMPIWKQTFCTENCKNIYDACAGHTVGIYTAEESADLLAECDLNDFEHFHESIKNVINEVTKITTPKKNKRKEKGKEFTEVIE